MVTPGHLLGVITALLVIVAVVGAAYAGSRREAATLKAENARLWALIQSMRAVTIDPPKVHEVVRELVREDVAEPMKEVTQDTFRNRFAQREVFYDEEPEQPADKA
jgi:hypothetical protein